MHPACTSKRHHRLCYHGQSLAEYGLLLALVAVACIGSLTFLGGSVGNGMNQIGGSLTSAIGSSTSDGAAGLGQVAGKAASATAQVVTGGTVKTESPVKPSATTPGVTGPIASVPTVVPQPPGGIILPEQPVSTATPAKPPEITGVPSVSEK